MQIGAKTVELDFVASMTRWKTPFGCLATFLGTVTVVALTSRQLDSAVLQR
jgi:hypothetical protein